MGIKERAQEFRRDASEYGNREALTKLLKREVMGRYFRVLGWDPAAAKRFVDWGIANIGYSQIQVELSYPGPTNPKTTLFIPTAQKGERILGISITEDSYRNPNEWDVVARFEVPFRGIKFDGENGGVVFTSEAGERVAMFWRNGASLEPGFRVIEPEMKSALVG